MTFKPKLEDCVCEIVQQIVAAQDAVQEECCLTSCERSIDQLLSPQVAGNGNTTIPFFLYCKGCKPYIASGVFQETLGMTDQTFFGCVETPIFRAKKFVEGSDCCVQLELLLPVTTGGSTPGPGGDDVCDFFPGNSIRDLQATGICITVDLNCFCAIACLDPVTPLPVTALSNTTINNNNK